MNRAPWLDESNFPLAPREASHGYGNGYGTGIELTPCTAHRLRTILRRDFWHDMTLAWTPERERVLPPIEFPSLREACRERQIGTAVRLLASAALSMLVFAVPMLLILLLDTASIRDRAFVTVLAFGTVTLSLLFIDAALEFRRARRFTSDYITQLTVATRYGIWLVGSRRGHWFLLLPLVLLAIWALQVYTPAIPSATIVGLVKAEIREGEYWRLLTGPLIHHDALHAVANAGLLGVVAWQLERILPRGSVATIVITGMLAGAACSVVFESLDSIGASGGAFALVGAALVFDLRHRVSLPRRFIAWTLIDVTLLLSYGFFVPRVDNATHVGGLLTGLILGYLATDDTSRVRRWIPVLGRACSALLGLSVALVFYRHWEFAA